MHRPRIPQRGHLLVLLALLVLAHGSAAAPTPESPLRVSGPYLHENLGLYLVHRADAPEGPPLLTLDAALAAKKVIVHETGSVNELAVENVSDRHVFLQAGDIVKGGQQDRVLSQDLVLEPRSGRVPIASFCVERGRWSARGDESPKQFQSSKHSLSSKSLKLAARREADQGEVWRSVAELQQKLGRAAGAPGAAAESGTSLPLSLENEGLGRRRSDYEEALADLPASHPDAVGLAVAINGAINSAEVSARPDLFRDLWPKLLASAVTEAIAERPTDPAAAAPAPEPAKLEAFLDDAREGKDAQLPGASPKRDARETEDALFFESRLEDESWLHRSYLAK